MASFCYLATIFLVFGFLQNAVSIDYGTALTKSLLFYEGQRSGKLPPTQRVQWRGDSALDDGKDDGVDLVGGYYDAGDNMKFGLPMAFTVTMLAWSGVEFGPQLEAQNELSNALTAVRWGTDYLIKAHPAANVFYGQVGDGGSDHSCWQRPEDITTRRNAYKIDEQHPGSDLAGESAAAFAAAAVAFGRFNRSYSSRFSTMQNRSPSLCPDNLVIKLFDLATRNVGRYQDSIPGAGQFYSSSGYEDELLWAAAWLARATNDDKYIDFITKSVNSGGTRTMFSWDDKYVGAQLLISKGILEGKFPGNGKSNEFKNNVEQYICNCIQKGSNNVKTTHGGLLWFNEWNNLQYVTSALFIITDYADILSATKNILQCPGGAAAIGSGDLIEFAKSQVDYILGSNPKQMSYMVGFGSNYPRRIHHRGASIVSIKKNPSPVSCKGGFGEWFTKDSVNPNVLDGAIVGGPDQSDEYRDDRNNFQQAEPAIANNAPFVGVLARFA